MPATPATNTTIDEIQPGYVVQCQSEGDFYAVIHELAKDRLVVVDCYATWCPPCQQMAPIFLELATQYPTVVFVKIDADQHMTPSLKNEIGVWALPTFAFFKNGQKVGSFLGADESLLRRGLDTEGKVSICSAFCVIQ